MRPLFLALFLFCTSARAAELEQPMEKIAETRPEIVQKLETAAKDLTWTSETDSPVEVLFWPSANEKPAALTPEAVAAFVGAQKSEARELKALFENAETVEDWMEADEKAAAKRFGELRKALEELKPLVVLVGDAKKDVYIVARIEGGIVGVYFVVVET